MILISQGTGCVYTQGYMDAVLLQMCWFVFCERRKGKSIQTCYYQKQEQPEQQKTGKVVEYTTQEEIRLNTIRI